MDSSIDLNDATIFVVEAPEIFSQIVYDLHYLNESSRLKIFTENQKCLKANDVLLVIDILDFNFSSPIFQKRLAKDIENQLNYNIERKIELENLLGKLYSIISDELLNHELDIDVDEIEIPQLIKTFHPHLIFEGSSIYEKMLDIIKIYSYLRDSIQLIIFVNAGSYLTNNEYEEVKQYILLNNVRCLFLESSSVDAKTQYILDEDYYLHGLE